MFQTVEVIQISTESQPRQSDNTSTGGITEEDWVSFTSSLATIEEADEEEILSQAETIVS